MAYFSAWLLKRASNAKFSLDNAIVFYILVMMASMLAGAVWYFLEPTTTGIIEALGLNMIVMSAGVIAVLRYWAGEDDVGQTEDTSDINELELERSIKISSGYVVYVLVMMTSMTATEVFYLINSALTGLEEGLIAGTLIMTAGVIGILWYSAKNAHGKVPLDQKSVTTNFVRGTLILLILSNEFFMGWLFTVVSGTPKITGNSFMQISASTLTAVLGSDWFLFTMSLEIILSIYMLRSAFSRSFVQLVCLQSLALVFVPTAIETTSWSDACAVVDSAILICFLVLAHRYLFQKKSNKGTRKYFFTLLTVYVLMMIGFVDWALQGNALLLLIPAIAGMVVYFKTIIERTRIETHSSITGKLSEPPRVEDKSNLSLT